MRSTEPCSRYRPSIDHRVREASRIPALIVQTEAELEVLRLPGVFLRQFLHPDAQVPPQVVDFVAPDPFNRGRERLGVLGSHTIEHGIEGGDRMRQRLARDRQRVRASSARKNSACTP